MLFQVEKDKDYQQLKEENVTFKELIDLIKEDIMEQNPQIINFVSLYFDEGTRQQIKKRRFIKMTKFYSSIQFSKNELGNLFH